MFILGLSWFSLWSLVAGLSVYSNYKLAVVSRVLQGIGPAICLPNALAILGITYPPGHRKAMIFALFGSGAPVGSVFGGALASLLTLAWWPWALWAMSIWLALLAVAAGYVIPNLPRKTVHASDWKSWVRILDLPGLLSASLLWSFSTLPGHSLLLTVGQRQPFWFPWS